MLWFPKKHKTHFGKFTKKWFGLYRIQFCLPNNIFILVTMDKFDPNLKLVNVNKLKPSSFWRMKHKVQEVLHLCIGGDKVTLLLMRKMMKKSYPCTTRKAIFCDLIYD